MLDATPFLRLYARRRSQQLASQDPAATQERTLLELLKKARDTRFGKDHSFDSISSVAEFQKKVRLRRYEDFWNEYFKASFPRLENCTWPGLIRYFPVSSGTSAGPTKFLPYSKEMQDSNTKAGLDLLTHHVLNRPHSKVFAGNSFVLGGTTELVEQAPGIWSGDLSGIAVKTLPWWARLRYFPPQQMALIKDWEEKIDTFARASLKTDIRMISGVPNWLLIYFDKLRELCPQADGKISNIYPHLEMLVHGGVNFAPYVRQFTSLLEGSNAEMREVYPASEGFIAVADRGYGDGLRMQLDSGIFYEFIPLEEINSPQPTRHWIKNIELGVNYALVMTTCAGLWSYIIGDTVKFVDRNPARLLITGRISYYLSAFGEHLLGEEIESAISKAAEAANSTITDYSVGAVYPQSTAELGGHLYIVEFAEGQAPKTTAHETFITTLDQQLRRANEDYEAHRANNFGLSGPKLAVVKPGTFAAWMKARGKLGGQNKVPRIISDAELFDNLQRFAAEHRLS
ncbi:MAG: GH3 auxin-responsive promoter family protein [Deltaproteobacteria bacterium]|nr:GH3 auxin-responsive promoter family protein [Deltaproteobacteria bacterium]